MWQKYVAHSIVTGPKALCIFGIDYCRRGYFKDTKGYQCTFGIVALEMEGQVISKTHSPFNSPIWPV